MNNDQISWERRRFKKNKVWLAVDCNGNPVVKDAKVRIKYQLEQDYEYWVHEHSVQSLDPAQPEREESNGKARKLRKPKAEKETEHGFEDAPGNAVHIYTDGASSGNPGPSGVGVLLRFGKHEKEISRYIGVATNNIAELEAIRTGLLELKKTDVPVRIFTDSEYAYGVLVRKWKTRKNQELVSSIKNIISNFKDLELVKVKGHAGVEGNEIADRLATAAIKHRE
ncbi:MAG: ribonuclease H [Pseudomonadota bacterium]